MQLRCQIALHDGIHIPDKDRRLVKILKDKLTFLECPAEQGTPVTIALAGTSLETTAPAASIAFDEVSAYSDLRLLTGLSVAALMV